jgi:hypothetical protein
MVMMMLLLLLLAVKYMLRIVLSPSRHDLAPPLTT